MALKMVDLPSRRDMVKNIHFIYSTASMDDKAEGMNWYSDAHEECRRIADKYNIDFTTIVALVSVISPGLMWGGNITMPEKIIDLWERDVPVEEWEGFNCWPTNLHKAVRILNGDMTAMRGLKVEAFFANILGETSPVTIDRWAIRAALDNPHLGSGQIEPSGKGVYNELAETYREVANLVNQAAPDVQAVVWTVFRNKYNGKVRKAKEEQRALQGVS